MVNVESILNEFFADTVDTLKEGIEQSKKRERLKGAKWTQERTDKASNETINKTYAEDK